MNAFIALSSDGVDTYMLLPSMTCTRWLSMWIKMRFTSTYDDSWYGDRSLNDTKELHWCDSKFVLPKDAQSLVPPRL